MSANVVPLQTPIRTTVIDLRWSSGEDFADMEATDAEVFDDGTEQVDVGGGGLLPMAYLRFRGENLVAAADALKRLADQIIDAVMDARQEKLDAERRCCPYCLVVKIEPDEDYCGSIDCGRLLDQDLRHGAWT